MNGMNRGKKHISHDDLRPLLQQLDSKDPRVRKQATDLLAIQGAEILEPLLTAFHKDERIRGIKRVFWICIIVVYAYLVLEDLRHFKFRLSMIGHILMLPMVIMGLGEAT